MTLVFSDYFEKSAGARALCADASTKLSAMSVGGMHTVRALNEVSKVFLLHADALLQSWAMRFRFIVTRPFPLRS